MTLVDDPSFGMVDQAVLEHRPRRAVPMCQRLTRCQVCGDVYVGVVAFVTHVTAGRCEPIDRTGEAVC